jgi:hypothetical protein
LIKHGPLHQRSASASGKDAIRDADAERDADAVFVGNVDALVVTERLRREWRS